MNLFGRLITGQRVHLLVRWKRYDDAPSLGARPNNQPRHAASQYQSLLGLRDCQRADP